MKKTPKDPKPPIDLKANPSPKVGTNSTEFPSKWIRIDRSFLIPLDVREVLHRLDDDGHIAYVVGGSVRDFLLEREAKDHDVATSALPDEICELFPESITVGKAFGVIKVPLKSGALLEIATFREDLPYRDHRHPEGVRFTNAVEDARRRDFTINALFYDWKTMRVFDPTGGMEDLKAKMVRAIGDPQARFDEDALRLLRAVRFVGQLGFSLERNTKDAIPRAASLLGAISYERIRDELTLMLGRPSAALSIAMLSDLKLLQQILPEVEALKKNPIKWAQLLKQLEVLYRGGKPASEVAWATLLNEIERTRVEGVCHRLHLSGDQTKRIRWLVEEQPKFKEVFEMREATFQRFIRQERFDDLLQMQRAVAIAGDGNLIFYQYCLDQYRAWRESEWSTGGKLIGGDDLIELGFSPGPEFARILRVVEDLSLEGTLTSKAQALEYVIKRYVR